MIKHSGPAIERASIGGTQSLRFAPRSKLTTFPPSVPTDFTNTVVEDLPAPKAKKSTKAKRSKSFTPEQVSHNQFLSQAHDRYQGYQKGPTGTDRLELPLSWDPVYTASYRPDVAGNAFEQGAGEVAEMDNLDTRDPKMNPQFHGKGSFLTPAKPNPYPIQVSEKFVIR